MHTLDKFKSIYLAPNMGNHCARHNGHIIKHNPSSKVTHSLANECKDTPNFSHYLQTPQVAPQFPIFLDGAVLFLPALEPHIADLQLSI